MATVYLSLGTNIGDRWQNLRAAVAALDGLIAVQAVSAVYETAPWGPIQEQSPFFNCCVLGETDLEPEQVLVALKRLEGRLGARESQRFGPRTIDIDVLAIGAVKLRYSRWKLPKPQIEQQAFVLVPLQEVAPTWRHPVSDCTIDELLHAIDCCGVVRLDEPL